MTRRSLLAVLLLLTAAAAFAQPHADLFDIEVVSPIASLSFRVIDAEYSAHLDAIVAVAESPNALYIYKPDTQAMTTVLLNLVPRCVSVSPDGKFAAVGHNAKISYVDLEAGTLVKTLDVSTNVLDVVLAGNGFVYAFPVSDQWQNIHCVRIDTNVETLGLGSIYAGMRGRLHPGGTSIYGADNGLSPSDIEKHDISGGTADFLYDSPYHGDFSMCGNVWFSTDGSRIFTPCGNVFRSTNDPATDMRYAGSMTIEAALRWISHTAAGNNIAALPSGTTGNKIRYYTPDFYVFRGTATLPSFSVENQTWPSFGRWIFFNTAGTKQYVVVQADQGSGILYDYGVVTIDCSGEVVSVNPSTINLSASAANLQIPITGAAGCGWKAMANDPWLNTLSSGVGNGTMTMTVTANNSLSPRTGTVTIGNATLTVNQGGVIPVNVTATATSPTSVNLSWSSPSVDHFEVWRNAGAGFVLIGSPVANSFVDTTVNADSGYVYKVRAVLTGGAISEYGTPDYAHTFTFTDAVLTGQPLRAVHITELRSAVNAIRAAAGLSAATFTDATLTGVAAKRVHVTELRDAIAEVRSALAMSAITFSSLPVNSVIYAAMTQEVRAATN